MDTQATTQLCMEAVGLVRLSAIAKAGDRCTLGLVCGQIGTWSLAVKQKPCTELRNVHIIFCGLGAASLWGGQKMTQSTEPPWYVNRMPGGVGGEEL